ncbi:hypothetical protein QUA70_17720 [Microcoleus sp. LAD1_D5]|uniref:hypothetical protein n=1 Tax=Microcoleus sp. LAD1_D5 TaxID=2818813 RepID=UPI002FD5E511
MLLKAVKLGIRSTRAAPNKDGAVFLGDRTARCDDLTLKIFGNNSQLVLKIRFVVRSPI